MEEYYDYYEEMMDQEFEMQNEQELMDDMLIEDELPGDAFNQSGPVTSNTDTNKTFTDILNYPRYYKACNKMDYGIHGPEVRDDKLYISIYHYLQYIGKNPRNYDTFSLGKYLTQCSVDYETCKYECQNFDINKFDLTLLKKEEINFDKYLN